MAFWSRLLGQSTYDPAQRVLPEPMEPFWGTGGIPVMDPGTPMEFLVGSLMGEPDGRGGTFSAADMWRRQPHLRKVIDFVARSVASTPLKVYERVSDTDRRAVSDGPLATILRRPSPRVNAYRFWHAVLSDGLLYDRWAVLVDTATLTLTHIPSAKLRFRLDDLHRVDGAAYWVPRRDGEGKVYGGDWKDLPLDRLIFDHGYAPTSAGLSPVATLKDILDENAESVSYRRETWRNGARVPGFIHRPADAPRWEKAHRDRFVTAMREYAKEGSRAGGLPILEDGMEIRESKTYSPRDAMDIDGRQLSAIEIATAFHVAPELLGARQGNYSNMDAFRQMLYGPSLGPYIVAWESAVRTQLVPMLMGEDTNVYVEAAVEAKLRGTFVEQAEIMQTATGGPWLLTDEARALMNLPPIEGGDKLITPLNVYRGDPPAEPSAEPAPEPAPPADVDEPKGLDADDVVLRELERALSVKAPADATPAGSLDEHRAAVEAVLRKHFGRQADVVLAALGAKADADWWDAERWDRELAEDLRGPLQLAATAAATSTLKAHDRDVDAFRPDRMDAYWTAATAAIARRVNGVTLDRLKSALSDGGSAREVFDHAKDARAVTGAEQLTSQAAGFGAIEAGQQVGGKTKTWRAGPNPRSSHAAMDGETVPLGEKFSNGLDYPGAYGVDASEVAGCNCRVDIGFEETA